MTAKPMAPQTQPLKVKSVKTLPMERQNAENAARVIVMDVTAENATPTTTATLLRICKLIRLRKKCQPKKKHPWRVPTLTVRQAPLHPQNQQAKQSRQLLHQRQSQ
jgi:hypothetical protein